MTAVVLLPGMDGSGELFADFICAMGGKPIVMTYPPDRPLGYEQLEEIVKATLPQDEPYMIVAESFSGPIAISLASSRPSGLQALVLVCTFARYPVFRSTSIRALLGCVPFWRVPVSLGSLVLLGRFGSASLRERLAAAVQKVAPSAWKSRIRAALSVDVTDRLANINVPVLYLRASNDRVVPPSASLAILRANPAVRLSEIQGPHFLLQARARDAAVVIRAFADEHGIQFD